MSGLQWIKKVSVFLISLFNITMRKRILDYNQYSDVLSEDSMF